MTRAMTGPGPLVVTLGETMALMTSDTVGPLARARGFTLGIGGSESNVAVGLRRLGTDSAWVGRVGDDAFGALIERELRAEDVQIHPVVDPGAPTGLMLKEHRTSRDISVVYYRSGSAGSRLDPGDVPEGLIESAAVLHLTGITPALSESARRTTVHAIDVARRSGVPISFDVNHRSALWTADEARPVLRRIIARVDLVFAGEDEAELVVGPADDPAELARRLAALGPREVVIKRGDAGALALLDDEEFARPAIPITPLDTVGAGDAFVAGYLAERVRGADVPERLSTANRMGAYACLVPGDWEGLPTRSELESLGRRDPVRR